MQCKMADGIVRLSFEDNHLEINIAIKYIMSDNKLDTLGWMFH